MAISTLIVVPETVTCAVPLPETSLPATGLRLALTQESAAKAGPTREGDGGSGSDACAGDS